MIYDSFVMSAVMDELSETLTGGKIERITQPSPLEVIVRVYSSTGKHDVMISADADAARCHLTRIKRENPPQPYAFCMLLRKHIDGAKIVGFDRPGGFSERILAIRCRSYDAEAFTVLMEIMGKHSNIILLDAEDVIAGAAKHITHDINRYREILPGKPYSPPPRQRFRQDPFEVYLPPSDDPIGVDDAPEWLLKTFGGVSPLLARETLLRCEPPYSPRALWQALAALLDPVRTHVYGPVVWTDGLGNTLGAYPTSLRSVDPANQHPRQSISVALDNASEAIDRRDTFVASRDALSAALHRACRRRTDDAADIEKGLANVERADTYQQNADLLTAQQDTLERGAATVSVSDYYAPQVDGGHPARVIDVDPALSWRENAERYYKKAAKARASKAVLEERQQRVNQEMVLLEDARRDVAAASTEDQVEAIHERVAGLLTRAERTRAEQPDSAGPQAPPRFEGHKIKVFRSVDGWEILVGENATSNDYLTTHVALPSDIWLHVRAATSAHGVIRAQNRPASVSAATLRHAAELVAARSEVKHSSLIPVDYTLKKYVRKPRKSAPGTVVYQNEKTLYVGGVENRS
ncbi:MAG: NFACT family protein [Capsulimonadaceae bacterium]